MRILVTGSAGYIGTILCRTLLDAGHTVVALDNLRRGGSGLGMLCRSKRFTFVRGDAMDVRHWAKGEQIDAVIPLAGIVGLTECQRHFDEARRVNCEAIGALIDWASLQPHQPLILYPMTNSGYGTTDGKTECDESSPLVPISHYGKTKLAGEHLVLGYHNGCSFRLATVFGMSPNMRWDLLVNDFCLRAVRDRSIVLFEGHAKRNYVHVQDVADCFTWALGHFDRVKGRPWNLGNDSANCSKRHLADRIAEYAYSTKGYVDIIESKVGSDPDKRNYIVSSRRLTEAGFRAKRSLEDGIRECLKGATLL